MDWKKILHKIFLPPMWIIIGLACLSTGMLVHVFVTGIELSPLAYVAYVLSFYSLVLVVILCWKVMPAYYKGTKAKVYENKYANKYFTDVAFKTHVKLYSSLGVDFLYAAVNTIAAVLYGSYWFGVFAGYYAIMATMRFLLLRYVGKNQIGESRLDELKRSRVCAYILMTVNLSLTAAVLMMIYHGKSFEYQGFLIYAIALYTFIVTISAVIELVKYRKYMSPVMSMSKVIKLAGALFSMLFLETAMLSQFGIDTPTEVKNILIMTTGGGISAIVVAMAMYMIVRSTKEIRKIERNGI